MNVGGGGVGGGQSGKGMTYGISMTRLLSDDILWSL